MRLWLSHMMLRCHRNQYCLLTLLLVLLLDSLACSLQQTADLP